MNGNIGGQNDLLLPGRIAIVAFNRIRNPLPEGWKG